MDDPAFYVTQTRLTDPGPHSDLLAGAPSDLRALRRLPLNVSVHHRKLEAAGVDIAPRRDEPHMRSATHMLGRVRELADEPLLVPRPLPQRLIGHCRTSAVLMTTLLRAQGVPARARSGFSAYWDQDMDTTHWVTEHWSADERRWVTTDANLDDDALADAIKFDAADIPDGEFVHAGQAWLLLRRGEVEPLRFGDDPDTYGLDHARGVLLRDVAALAGIEVGAFDTWGPSRPEHAPSADELALLDRFAELSTAAAPDAGAAVRELYEASPSVHVPDAIVQDGAAAATYASFVPDIWRADAGR